MRARLIWAADLCAVALLAALLIAPLFRVEYLANWGSIDSTFIADARFLKEHGPSPGWLPHWYCGTRFDYVYPPALRYGTAALSLLAGVSTARAYHWYTAFLYCLGVAGVYALVRSVGASRRWGWLAAAATAALSPSFLFLKSFRDDAALHMPQRLNVLLKWGEGPHIAALALIPFALLFSWRALRDGGRAWLALAAASCALVVSHNFYGAMALAILFPLLVWALWLTHRPPRVLGRAAAIAALSYGLTAAWLTPSYVRVTFENLKLVAQPGTAWSRWAALGLVLLFLAASARLASRRKEHAWRVFVCGAALLFTLDVAGHHFLGFRFIGEPHRFVPEWDLVLILVAVEALRALARGRRSGWAAAALAAAAFAPAYSYLSQPWSVVVADPDYRARVEYRLAEWTARHLPGARVFATGSFRLWYNAWRDGAQVGGGSDQGLLNGVVSLAQWQVIHDTEAGRDIAWLQAMGADAVIVPQPGSAEIFHEYAAAGKFAGHLPVLHDDGQGTIVYRVPRRFPARARVVETRRVGTLKPIPVSDFNRPALDAYVAAIESGPDRAVEMRWEGPASLRLRARLEPGQSLLVQETFDPAWRAWCEGRPVPVHADVAGFMRVDAPPGDREVQLIFQLPAENAIGRALALASLAAVALLAAAPVLRLLHCAPWGGSGSR